MTCTWCSDDAVTVGRAPIGVVGQTELPSCIIHKEVLKKLNYTMIPDLEFQRLARQAAKETKAK